MTANPKYEHLVNNLQRSESSDSLLNQIFQRKYSSSLAQWNLEKWLEELLPNTRLIIEPKIFGCGIALSYKNCTLQKVMTREGEVKIYKFNLIKNFPERIPIRKAIQLRGIFIVMTSLLLNLKDLQEYLQIDFQK